MAETNAHLHLADVERWFIKRGLPHFIEDYRATDDVFNRALPLVVLLLIFQMGLELSSRTVTWQHRVVGGLAGLAAVLVLFLIANLFRQRGHWYRMPRKVGVAELVVLVGLGPAVGFAVRARPQAVALDLVANIGVLILIYAVTAYALLPVVRWAVKHAFLEIGNLVNLASKALPMLALFGTFIFLNADMWHIAGSDSMTRSRLWTIVGFFGGITFLFLMVRLPDEVRRLAGGYTAESVTEAAAETPLEALLKEIDLPLRPLTTSRRQRANMLFVVAFTQIIQVLLLSLVVFAYFITLGKLAVSDEQVGDWLKIPAADARITDPGTLFGFDARFPVVGTFSDPLIKTAILITTFSAFFFAVSAVTDETYRKDFFESITGKLTKALDVRCGYLVIYFKGRTVPVSDREGRSYDTRAPVEDHRRTLAVPIWAPAAPTDTTVPVQKFRPDPVPDDPFQRWPQQQ